MPTFIVLLRGVNIGKAKRVPMAAFKTELESLGCTHVATLLNSGNAVVSTKKSSAPVLAAAIADALQRRFGFEVPVVVKSGDEWDAVIERNGLACGVEDHSRLLVAFAQEAAGLAPLQPMGERVVAPEAFLWTDQAAYLHCAGGILQSKAGAFLLGKAGQAITTRNWTTVLKLQALAQRVRGG